MLKLFGFPCAYPPDSKGITHPFKDNFKLVDKSQQKVIIHQYGLAHKGRIVLVDDSQHKIGYGISVLPGQVGCPVIADS